MESLCKGNPNFFLISQVEYCSCAVVHVTFPNFSNSLIHTIGDNISIFWSIILIYTSSILFNFARSSCEIFFRNLAMEYSGICIIKFCKSWKCDRTCEYLYILFRLLNLVYFSSSGSPGMVHIITSAPCTCLSFMLTS